MKRTLLQALVPATLTVTVSLAMLSLSGCGGGLAQPFGSLKNQPITAYHLQNHEVQPAASGGGVVPSQVPQPIQQWLNAGASLLPPGLLPPGVGPQAPTSPAPTDAPRFYNFPVLRTAAVTDPKTRDEILDIFGHESNFQMPSQSCVYAEFGFSIGGGGGAPGVPSATPSGAAPADVLVSLSCGQVQMNSGWPYGPKTGLTPDATKRIVAVVSKVFGG